MGRLKLLRKKLKRSRSPGEEAWQGERRVPTSPLGSIP